MPSRDLVFMPATDLAACLRNREVSAREVLDAHLQQIELVNPQVNAIVTLVADRAMADAARADEEIAAGSPRGPLHGIPIAHKDLVDTAGIRTTYGSPIYRDHVPEKDSLLVERMRAAGVITIGKTNTPEFGLGSQTFNPVFGATKNPHDLSRTCGGSSGGAAVSLATGMLPLADGSDTGGSLRNPAAFCGVVGMRPSPGRVPTATGTWSPLSVSGPMGRNVRDTALLLSVLAGPDPRSPLSLSDPGEAFRWPLERDLKGLRIAWSPTLGGRMPVEHDVLAVIEQHRATFESLGCVVEEASPPLDDAAEVFDVLRGIALATRFEDTLRLHRDQMKATAVWNVEHGLALTGAQIASAERARAALHLAMVEFFSRYDALVLPTTQVPPFPIEQEYVTEVAGVKMETYLDWMASCYLVSATACPAISVPAGFTPGGLPVGLQIVARHRGDFELLQLAHGFEQATNAFRWPAIAQRP